LFQSQRHILFLNCRGACAKRLLERARRYDSVIPSRADGEGPLLGR
jgi:hypothetical protein